MASTRKRFGILTRRDFVKGSLAAGVGLTAAPTLLAADTSPKRDPNTVALLADPHVGRVVYAKTLKRCMAEAAAAAPAHLIIAGDLAVSKGRRESYQTFLKVLDESDLSKRDLHLMVGNHDRHAALFDVLKEYAPRDKAPVKGRQVKFVQTPNANWLLLDSLPTSGRRRMALGVLGAAQMKWLAETLDAHKDKPAIVMAHHHLRMINSPRVPMCLKEWKEVLAMLLAHPHVKAYINGHVHAFVTLRHEGLHIVSLPSTSYTFPPGRVLGWVLAVTKPDGMELTIKAGNTKRRHHNKKVSLAWR